MMKRLRHLDWDAVAGVVAAVTALVLHLLHVVHEGVLLAIALVLLALMLIRDLRREERDKLTTEVVGRTETALLKLQTTLSPPDIILIGPQDLRAETERFARRAHGEMTWFNVCLLMFVPQSLFDVLLRPAIENPHVTAIRFILDRSERERWQTKVLPKVAACTAKDKVLEPHWCDLRESISFILAAVEPGGAMEAHVSFWGEPFMVQVTGQDIPRYILHVQAHSELVSRLVEIQRLYSVKAHTA